MRVVIVGIGKIGDELARRLMNENHDVVVVDDDLKTVENIVNKLDVKGVCGSGFEREVLKEAEVNKADCFFACTNADEMNMLCAALAKKMGAKYVIARVRDPLYFSSLESIKTDLGVDLIFNPEYRTAMEMAQLLKFPSAISTDTFSSGKVNLTEFKIANDNPIVGLSVMDAVNTAGGKLLFAVVSRGNHVYIPKGDFVIEAGDYVHIAAEDSELSSFCKKLHIFKQKAKNVMIIGGGKIGYYLAKKLLDDGVNVKIIEMDEERAKFLDEELPNAQVFCADGTDTAILEEEGLRDTDAFIALTGIDEENSIISLYATTRAKGKVITKVTNPVLAKMVKKLGLDTVISPREVITDQLVRFVRARQAEEGEGMSALYRIHDKAEAIEFTATDSFSGLNTPLCNLKLKNNVLLCSIVRNEEFILPSGDTQIHIGDKVLVVTGVKQITELEQILK